jgi:hypothetical protein
MAASIRASSRVTDCKIEGERDLIAVEIRRRQRNIVLPVDNSEESECAVSWALDHIYKAGDCLHLLHCIPQYRNKQNFAEAEDLAHAERQAATKEAIRKKFEAKLRLACIPESDIVYDIFEEDHVSTSLFAASPPLSLDTLPF